MTENAVVKSNRPAYMDMQLDKQGRLQLEKFEDLWMLCDWVIKAGFAPKDKKTPQQVFIAGQMGASLGFDFWTSLTNIMVVNGMPTVWGDAMLAKIQAFKVADIDGTSKPALEYFSEYVDGVVPEDTATAYCIVKRFGRGMEISDLFPERRDILTADPVMLQRAGWTVSSFSVADAKKASLLSKPGPWSHYPARMMAMRARAFALRNSFPDVLKGFYAREEFIGTAVEVEHEARQLDPNVTGADRDVTMLDYQDADVEEREPMEPGPAAGMKTEPDPPEDDEPDPGPGPEGGSKGEDEIVEPEPPQELEKPAEDPLDPKNMAATPPEVPEDENERLFIDRMLYHKFAPIDEILEFCESQLDVFSGSREEYFKGCLDQPGAFESLFKASRVQDLDPEDVEEVADEERELTPKEVQDEYWMKVFQVTNGVPAEVQKYKAYVAHMVKITGDREDVILRRGIKNWEGHQGNCHRWFEMKANTAQADKPKILDDIDHSPAEKAVASAHKEDAHQAAIDEAVAESTKRAIYTKAMLEIDERQDEADEDFDPLRYANVKNKRGKGVKAYYERHLDRFVEVLSHDTVDWAEEIIGPHRSKWNSITLTKALPFILDEKRRELQGAGEPSAPLSKDAYMIGLKDKIRSYQNYDEPMFRRVLNQLKVGGNPMTVRGAEHLLEALKEEYDKVYKG